VYFQTGDNTLSRRRVVILLRFDMHAIKRASCIVTCPAATATAILFAHANFRVKLQSKRTRFTYQEPHLFVTNEESFPRRRE